LKKKTTRPLLVGIVERWRALEQEAYRELSKWLPEEQVHRRVEWQTASRELTQAETLLWLADQQWDREEREALNLSPHASKVPIAPEPALETNPARTAKPL